MHRTTSRTPPTITADGKGVVSHAGTVLLSELADRIGLTHPGASIVQDSRRDWGCGPIAACRSRPTGALT